MTQSNNNFSYSYDDECISYKSLFPAFSRDDFNELDKTFCQLDIDAEIKKLFSEYKINTTEDQAALHHVYRSAYGENVSNLSSHFYEIAKSSIEQCINLKARLLENNIKNIVGADTLSPQLRIHFDTNLARTFINEAVSGSSTFSSNEDFKSYFKGLYVKTNNGALPSGDGAALYINLNDASSKVTMYFQQDGESKTYDLVMSSDGADFVHIDIDYAGYPVDQVIQDSTQGKVEFYAQAFTHRAAIKIPGLDSLPSSSIIHSANLELPVQFQSGTSYAPGTLTSVATRINSTDDFYTPLSSIGQYIDYKKQVEVDLRYYVQSLLTGEIDNTEVVVSPLYFINSADRIVFNGQNTTNKNKPRLILTYTTY